MELYKFEESLLGERGTESLPDRGVLSSQNFQKILEGFAKLGKLSIVAVDDKAEAVTRRFGINAFCAKMCNSPDFENYCARAHRIGLDEAVSIKDRFTYVCPFGLLESVIPLFTGNQLSGAVICGQAKCFNSPDGFIDMNKSKLLVPPPNFGGDPVNKSFFSSISDMDYVNYEALISLISEVSLSFMENLKNSETTLSQSELNKLAKTSERTLVKHARKSGINLFFLLNAINSLSNLSVLSGEEKINNLSILIARYIKGIINSTIKEFCRLEDEKNTILRYLNIQKIRYEDLLNFSVTLPIHLKDYLIPVDIVLPFIERIFILGVSTNSGKFQIGVFFKKEGNSISIEILDNLTSPGTTTAEIMKTPYKNESEIKVIENRIINATERLLGIFGSGASISIKAKEGGGSKCHIGYPAIISETND
ncbi:MAG: PocR ligand-binding domain-containing protein [Deltaproteobacteria bacterium]|jgi:ligand-binding sensor protein|nr:PocR ligand-binding domain-containing protein [Deltaproteobacteria bacterium]